MTAQPASEDNWDPHDPARILQLLPEQARETFLSEYRAALEQAREVRGYRQLQGLLLTWHTRAVAYARPGFAARRTAAASPRPGDWAAAEDVIPRWADLVQRAR